MFNVWKGMRQRCYNPKAHNFKWYGGKGITIEWEDFADFQKWAEDNGYAPGLQLDRVNRDGSYSPDNCWWVSPSDNLLRAGLYIDKDIDQMAVNHAKRHGVSFNKVVEDALRLLLVKGGEWVAD